jgi:hypothetical protein
LAESERYVVSPVDRGAHDRSDRMRCLRPGAILASCGQLKKISGPIGDAVIDELVERGLVRRRFDVPLSAAG